eukprot:TRINITY_DN8241_c0_g1_i6.p2 TRINITY_DN8241_c0_g1~~TRINITY_DN8241_c0_g1_i6.p2  ORF type:complete len:237 (+),score=49.32 TRINITY_DN8241_c0_g1_i6:183-893(+)
MSFPPLSKEEAVKLKFPRSTQDVLEISQIINRYEHTHFWTVLVAFIMLYLFLQAFAIPGAIFLSLLAGPLFGVSWGIVLVTFSATAGSTICYFISWFLAKDLVSKFFPQMIKSFSDKVDHHRSDLFYYMLFLRISPLLPNWFINVSSPIVGVPWYIFSTATLIGLLPANYIHVTTGAKLSEIGSTGTVNFSSLLGLLLLALVALIPTLFKKQISKLDAMPQASGSNSSPIVIPKTD